MTAVSPRPSRSQPRPGTFLTALLVCAGAACVPYPQRLPGPLVFPEEPGAEPEEPGATSQAATVHRDSDPVWVRRRGERGEYPIPFYAKRERLAVGSSVRTGAGGRAELLWPSDATSLVLFDEGQIRLGDPARDEPLLYFESLTHALLVLTPEDRVDLLGGARLRGDPVETSGPVLLERPRDDLQRVTNQSKRLLEIRFREVALELAPGESIDLPLLPSGGAPLDPGLEPERFGQGSLAFSWRGAGQPSAEGPAARLTASEPTLVEGLGVRAQLSAGESARFSGLSQVPPEPRADP